MFCVSMESACPILVERTPIGAIHGNGIFTLLSPGELAAALRYPHGLFAKHMHIGLHEGIVRSILLQLCSTTPPPAVYLALSMIAICRQQCCCGYGMPPALAFQGLMLSVLQKQMVYLWIHSPDREECFCHWASLVDNMWDLLDELAGSHELPPVSRGSYHYS